MNTTLLGVAVLGFVVVIGGWITYLRTIPKMKVPVDPIGSKVLQGIGIILGGTAGVLNSLDNLTFSVAVLIPSFLTVVIGFGFFRLLSLRKTPIGDLKVNEGDTLLPFTTVTSEGAAFHSGELAGKRVLLKFFRGGW